MTGAAAAATADPELLAHAGFWAGWRGAATRPTPTNVHALAEAQQQLASVGEDHFSRGHWTALGIERAVGRHAEATRVAELAKTETICKRCNVMVW